MSAALAPSRAGASKSALNVLVRTLAEAGETRALVRVWDVMGGRAAAEASTWAAVQKLHGKGKGRIPTGTLSVPALARRELQPGRSFLLSSRHSRLRRSDSDAFRLLSLCSALPLAARRLHKICKGARLSARSNQAARHFDAACRWLQAQRAGGQKAFAAPLSGRDKGNLSKQLKAALGVSKEVARGLVTKLKQTKRGKALLYGGGA